MITTLITLIIVFGLPAILMRAEKKVKLIKVVSPIIICYLVGIIIANTNFLNPDIELLKNLFGISVGLAIPLLLFSCDLKKWLGQASKTLLSFGISVFGVVVASTLAFFIFSGSVEEANKVSGMMIGVYTGGTPNMAAIGTAEGVDPEVFTIINGADVLISAIYFLFLLTVAKPLLRKFLPAFRNTDEDPKSESDFNMDDLKGQSFWNKFKFIGTGVILAALLFGLSYIILSKIGTPEDKVLPWIMFIVTTGAIALSFIPKVRNLKGTFKTAEYFLLVFAVAIGCLADIQDLIHEGPMLLLFCGFVVVVSILIHYTIAAFFKIDADTVIITSTAAIYGPAFVGPVANAIKNPRVIVSGVTMGLLGYSLAIYLAKGVIYLLGLF